MCNNHTDTKRKEGKFMSPKELLYIEDTLGHETQMKAACTDFSSKLEDADLKNFVTQIAQKKSECFNRFYGLLN